MINLFRFTIIVSVCRQYQVKSIQNQIETIKLIYTPIPTSRLLLVLSLEKKHTLHESQINKFMGGKILYDKFAATNKTRVI